MSFDPLSAAEVSPDVLSPLFLWQIFRKNVISRVFNFPFLCRCGFAGETGPRCIIPSVIKRAGMSKVFFFLNKSENYGVAGWLSG